MKILFTLQPPKGSFGGGAFFVKNMIDYLQKNGHEGIFNLEQKPDIIFLIDPRISINKKYGYEEIMEYKKKNPKVKIIYRVNECDCKREKSINIEPKVIKCIQLADITVFVSQWLHDYYHQKYNIKDNKCFYILNGVNLEHFYPDSSHKFTNDKIKIITHHWSDNYLKGFEIYNKLDQYLKNHPEFQFTYVGRYNPNYKPKNLKLIPPHSGKELGDIIRQHDIYLTATQNEPGAMHYLEGMACGLPILYRKNGGGAQEICKMAGEEFTTFEDMLLKIQKIKSQYGEYQKKIDYDYLSSSRCCKEFYEILIKLND